MKSNIYGIQKKVEDAVKKIGNLNISRRNKEFILKFRRHCILNNLTLLTTFKYLRHLPEIALALKKDFDKATIEDIKTYIQELQEKKYSPNTRVGYKVTIKRFYKWLKGNDITYPVEVAWIKTSIKRTEKNLPGEGDLLTEEDIKKLVDTAEHPRDKAFISVLYESGFRIGEMCSVRFKDVKFDEHGVLVCASGKTGSRRIRLISSVSFLSSWINMHPLKKDREAYLWIGIGPTNRKKPLHYSGIWWVLKRVFDKTDINKKFNPHLFRHSRATYLANHLTEFQMNQYFGWVQGSGMASTYVHLSGKNVDGAILELNGIKQDKEKNNESKLKPKKCPRCDTINGFSSKFCSRCAGILDIETAMEMNEEIKQERKERGIGDKIIKDLITNKEFQKMLVNRAIEMGVSKELIKTI